MKSKINSSAKKGGIRDYWFTKESLVFIYKYRFNRFSLFIYDFCCSHFCRVKTDRPTRYGWND